VNYHLDKWRSSHFKKHRNTRNKGTSLIFYRYDHTATVKINGRYDEADIDFSKHSSARSGSFIRFWLKNALCIHAFRFSVEFKNFLSIIGETLRFGLASCVLSTSLWSLPLSLPLEEIEGDHHFSLLFNWWNSSTSNVKRNYNLIRRFYFKTATSHSKNISQQ